MQNPITLTVKSLNELWVEAQQSSDESLLKRIVDGEKLAMQALFARHNARVFRFVIRLVGDETVAEDLVSEVFIDVWRNASRYAGHSQVSTWIWAIARFKAISVLRRHKDEMLDDAKAAAIPDTCDDPELSLQKKDRSAILRMCLGQLSEDHREVIDLVYYHEKSVEEVAEIVGVPKNTVKTRMYYARKRMSELLQQAGVDRTYQ